MGNGLVCLIDEKTKYRDFFNKNEMVFYKDENDLSTGQEIFSNRPEAVLRGGFSIGRRF